MQSIDVFATEKLARLEAADLRRALVENEARDGIWVTRAGQRLLSFSCNDYLNLSVHPDCVRAAREATDAWGVGAGASRLVTGNHAPYGALEARLAALKETAAACVFGSGYLANAGTVPVLVAPGDLILVDEWAHACFFAGARLSGAAVTTFRHNDLDHLGRLLADMRPRHRRVLVGTETVFSMDGDRAPLEDLRALCDAHDAWLMTDDAHGLGVVPTAHVAHVQMGTLSKAVGGYGGYVCASQKVIDLIKTRARTLVYTTGLPPGIVAAASTALDIIAGDPDLRRRPLAKAARFTARLGLAPAQSPIVPVVLGSARAALDLSARLLTAGFLVTAIRPPTVPEGTARLRVAFTAAHPDEAVDALADQIAAAWGP